MILNKQSTCKFQTINPILNAGQTEKMDKNPQDRRDTPYFLVVSTSLLNTHFHFPLSLSHPTPQSALRVSCVGCECVRGVCESEVQGPHPPKVYNKTLDSTFPTIQTIVPSRVWFMTKQRWTARYRGTVRSIHKDTRRVSLGKRRKGRKKGQEETQKRWSFTSGERPRHPETTRESL